MYKLLHLQVEFNSIRLPLTAISPEVGAATVPEFNTWKEFHPTPVQRFVSKGKCQGLDVANISTEVR